MIEFRRNLFATAHVRGQRHERANEPCQDFAKGAQRGMTTIVAVADGAGSCRHSEVGAQIAVETVIELAGASFSELFVLSEAEISTRIIAAIRERLEERARIDQLAVEEMASTIAFVALRDDLYLAGNVGDGVIGRLQGRMEVLLRPRRGEHANETWFTTSRRSERLLDVAKGTACGGDGFFIATDGAADSLYDRRANTIAPAAGVMLSWLGADVTRRVESAVRDSLEHKIRLKTHDDCSIAVVRKLSLDMPQLISRTGPIFEELVAAKSARGARTRVAIIEALGEGITSVKEVGARCGLSATSVRRHLAELALQGIEVRRAVVDDAMLRVAG